MLLLAILPIFQARTQQTEDPVTTISLQAIPGLQYDVVRFSVKPGEKIKLIFTNNDDMGHNLLITTPGSRLEIVNAALQLAEKGPIMDYIPASPQVLWNIPVTYPGERKSVQFIAPKAPGAYPYVCTYPGHGFVMYGVMYVSTDGKMPDITEDLNIPPSRRQETSSEKSDPKSHTLHQEEKLLSPHPYEPVPPYLYRVFIEGSGLASIAVNLPHNLSYCWDAGACQLRFAWEGGFLDNRDLWHGHKNAYAKILGEIFYRDKTIFPLRIGDPQKIPAVEYKGYRLIKRYPEFHYQLSGKDVYELIHPKPDGSGLIRTFRISEVEAPVWFIYDREDGVSYESSAGEWEGRVLKLTSTEAKEFTITMTKKTGK